MTSIIKRIEEIIFDQRLNDAKFEKATGKSSGYLNTLRKSNKRSPGADFIIEIVQNFPEYNLDWLILGEGPKLKSETNSYVNEDNASYLLRSHEVLKSLEKFIREIVKEEIEEPISNINQDLLKLLKRVVNKETSVKNGSGSKNG